MSSSRLYKKTFTGNGTWTCPAGIKFVIITGCGGGGGGGSGASSSGRGNSAFASGGSGGQAAVTITQVVSVIPGMVYTIAIGLGGIGGTAIGVPGANSGGGQTPGNPGSAGGSSLFGSYLFPGGLGGKEGGLVTLACFAFPAGTNLVSPNPSIQVIQNFPATPAFSASQGIAHSVNRSTNQYSISGGGTGGGASTGILNGTTSYGGAGGNGAQGFDGNPFSTGGLNGYLGGGGGGGGDGENWDYLNTGNGSNGGGGGAGFIEIGWTL